MMQNGAANCPGIGFATPQKAHTFRAHERHAYQCAAMVSVLHNAWPMMCITVWRKFLNCEPPDDTSVWSDDQLIGPPDPAPIQHATHTKLPRADARTIWRPTKSIHLTFVSRLCDPGSVVLQSQNQVTLNSSTFAPQHQELHVLSASLGSITSMYGACICQ
jgi:hypothetical protein